MIEKIAQHFKKPEGFLGRITSGLMIKGNRPVYETLIKYMNIRPNDRMLEIGYGPGVGISLILSQFESCSIDGIDFSELMYKKASERNKKAIDSKKVKLMFGDFIETDIDARDFDKIYFTNVVYFWDDLKKPFEKLHSLLKNGGMVFFYMAGKEYLEKQKFTNTEVFNRYSIEQITTALRSAGFREIEHIFEKGYYIKAKK